ncbi:MAG: hypothetical protein AAF804_05645, partial [Bacteroidota bacterium]
DIPRYILIGGPVYADQNYLKVQKASYHYYQFLKSWPRHIRNLQTGGSVLLSDALDNVEEALTRGEPAPLYSNIEGGLGIFAARSASVYLRLKRQ